MELYQKKCVVPVQTGKRQGLVSGTGFGLSIFLFFCFYACSFYAGAQLVGKGKTTMSEVFQVCYCPNLEAFLDSVIFLKSIFLSYLTYLPKFTGILLSHNGSHRAISSQLHVSRS